MNKFKKAAIMMAGAAMISGSAVQPAMAADSAPSSVVQEGDQQLSYEDAEILTLIQAHTTTDEATGEISFVDKNILESAVENSENFSMEELEKGITEYNSIINGEQGAESKEELQKTLEGVAAEVESAQQGGSGEFTTMGCSDWLSAIGFGHTTSVSALAVALGVSGPAALAVATAMGATYAAGSIACPN